MEQERLCREEEDQRKPDEWVVDKLKFYLDELMDDDADFAVRAADAISAEAIMSRYNPRHLPYDKSHIKYMFRFRTAVERHYREYGYSLDDAQEEGAIYFFNLNKLCLKIYKNEMRSNKSVKSQSLIEELEATPD